MNSESLFTLALGLESPWFVQSSTFELDKDKGKVLMLHINFKKGAKFPDKTGVLCPVYDTVERRWQHLSFFEHKCFISARVPRITNSSGKVETVLVPWARPGSDFTLMFEALAMLLIESEMPVSRVGELMGVDSRRIWTIFNHWVGKAIDEDSPQGITALAIDETSAKKGHTYVTLAVDIEQRKLIHTVSGKDKATVRNIRQHLERKGVKATDIKEACIDLSPAFIAGVIESFPQAQITFDRFHVVKLLNKVMDDVRRHEQKNHPFLKGIRYAMLKNEENLTKKQRQLRDEVIDLYPNLGEAYRLKVWFNDLWDLPDERQAEAFVREWCAEVDKKKIVPFMDFAKTVRSHMTGIISFVRTRISNGLLEGINSKIQLAKRRARGYRNIENFMNMIRFLCGKLKFAYPLYPV